MEEPVRLRTLARAAMSGTLFYTRHYDQQRHKRPTPTRSDITFMLCDDAPMIIDENPDHHEGPTYLVWATRADGRIGHIVCPDDSSNTIITAYFPGCTNPEKWDADFITRRDYDR